MISASNDSQQQEQLIEKYMSLPNQVWDDIINQAAKNVSDYFHFSTFLLKVSKFQKQVFLFSFEQKKVQNYFFIPVLRI